MLEFGRQYNPNIEDISGTPEFRDGLRMGLNEVVSAAIVAGVQYFKLQNEYDNGLRLANMIEAEELFPQRDSYGIFINNLRDCDSRLRDQVENSYHEFGRKLNSVAYLGQPALDYMQQKIKEKTSDLIVV